MRRRNQKPKQRHSKMLWVAKQRGLSCDISLESYLVLLSLPCFYCFGPLPEAGYALDRLDSSAGYSLGNVVPCCSRCNSMKLDRVSPLEMKAMMGMLSVMKGLRREDPLS